jgi:hypothetical protein
MKEKIKEKIGKTENKFLAVVRIGKQTEIFGFKTKANRDSFAKEVRSKGAEVITSNV